MAAVAENNTGIEIEPLFEEQVDFDTFSKSDFRVVKAVSYTHLLPEEKKYKGGRTVDELLQNMAEGKTLDDAEMELSLIHIFE